MTSDDFRRLALSMPEAVEQSHMGHPDFRVRGKIFATLAYPDGTTGMVKLNPEQQYDVLRGHPETFVAVNGAWGRQGATYVQLERADRAAVEGAMRSAWGNVVEKKPARKRKTT